MILSTVTQQANLSAAEMDAFREVRPLPPVFRLVLEMLLHGSCLKMPGPPTKNEQKTEFD